MNETTESRFWKRGFLAVLLLAGAGSGAAQAATFVTNAVLVEDSLISSQYPGTVYGNSGAFLTRRHVDVTRASLLQFDLPRIEPGDTCTESAFVLSYRNSSSAVWVDHELGCISTNPNIAILTWNGALNNDIVLGREADYTVSWGPSVTIFPETVSFPGKLYSPAPTSFQWVVYRDLTPEDGLTQYINNKLSTSATVRATFVLGPVSTAALYEFNSKDNVPPGTPVLELTLKRPSGQGTLIQVR